MPSWRLRAEQHHGKAHAAEQYVSDLAGAHGEPTATAFAGIIAALLAGVAVMATGVSELRKIRKLLEAAQSNTVTRFNLTGHLVPKEGGQPMPAGPFNPTDTDDVQLTIAPVNAAGAPVSDTFAWSSSDSTKVSLTVAPDTKTCLCVCTPGVDLDVIVSVTQPSTGKSDTASIQRTAPPPPDNAVASFNLSGTVVPKTT